MADTTITCPTCQHSFDLPQGPSSGRVECPRCRAKLRVSTRLKPPEGPGDRPERTDGLTSGQKACLWTIGVVVVALMITAGLETGPAPPAVTVAPVPPVTAPAPMPPPTGRATVTGGISPEKRRAIYQLYCNGRDIAFMAWFEAQPVNERLAWKSETPEVQANAKDFWVSIHHHQICETIAPFLAKANPPIHLTAGEISAIVREGRDQHWPERP
jgi:hypothetical protein